MNLPGPLHQPGWRFSTRAFVSLVASAATIAVWVLALAQNATIAGDDPPKPAHKVDFTREIRPILANHCWSCHGPDEHQRKAGLRLDSAQGARAKLESDMA